MKVTTEEVLGLARRAELENQPNLAHALYVVGGRMDRNPGWDGYDVGDPEHVAYGRGLDRLRRIAARQQLAEIR